MVEGEIFRYESMFEKPRCRAVPTSEFTVFDQSLELLLGAFRYGFCASPFKDFVDGGHRLVAESSVYLPQFIFGIQDIGYGFSRPVLYVKVIIECQRLFKVTHIWIPSLKTDIKAIINHVFVAQQ